MQPVLRQTGFDGQTSILEAEIALATLLRRLPDLRLTLPREELRRRPTPGFRRLESLPVRWPT